MGHWATGTIVGLVTTAANIVTMILTSCRESSRKCGATLLSNYWARPVEDR